MSKKNMPLRNGRSDKGDSKQRSTDCFNCHYTPEFTESQAEKIFNRDFNAIVVGCIVILVLAILGVI